MEGDGDSGALQTSSEFVPATRALARRQALILWHRTKSWVSRGGAKAVAVRLSYVIAYLWLPAYSAYKLGPSTMTITSFAIVMWGILRKAWNYHATENMQQMGRNYLVRKLDLGTLIERMHRIPEMTPAEIQQFREDTLKLIAMYVRDHRADWEGRSIFANVLVEDGDDMVVLARNQTHRQPLARYPKSRLAASRALQGESIVVGDLQKEFPAGDPKTYRSILILPIYLRGTIAGVISLDSEEEYHFDGEEKALRDCLHPYTSLLAWTLDQKYVKCALTR